MPDAYRLRILPSARKELESLQGTILKRVGSALRGLITDPRPRGSRKLVGTDSDYRIRIGDYRIAYEVDDRAGTIIVYRIRHRREAYR